MTSAIGDRECNSLLMYIQNSYFLSSFMNCLLSYRVIPKTPAQCKVVSVGITVANRYAQLLALLGRQGGLIITLNR
jgi:non-homologous end joining protein Ku